MLFSFPEVARGKVVVDTGDGSRITDISMLGSIRVGVRPIFVPLEEALLLSRTEGFFIGGFVWLLPNSLPLLAKPIEKE